MNIVNLTPHEIRLNNGLVFLPSGHVARVTEKREHAGWLSPGKDGHVELSDELLMEATSLYRIQYAGVTGLPDPDPGECTLCAVNAAGVCDCPGPGAPGPCVHGQTRYIVSGLVMQACPDRTDLLVPDTGSTETVRQNGQVYSVPGFVVN